MANHRDIVGRRRDLRGVRDAAALRSVSIEGPGIGSLEGIERMTSVTTVFLERLVSPELERLAALPALRTLYVEGLRGDVDWSRLEELRGLEVLRVEVSGEADAAAVAAIDFGRLPVLEALTLLADVPIPVDVSWAPRLQRLRNLGMQGFFLPDGAETALCEAPTLRRVGLTTLTMAQYERLSMCLPEANIAYPLQPGEELAPHGVVFEPEPGTQQPFSVGFDLAGTWDLETNAEAEALLRRELRRRAPDLLERSTFDTESDAVWLLSHRREDLDQVRLMIDAITAERDR